MSFCMVINWSKVTLEIFISCKLLPRDTCNSRRSRPSGRLVAYRSQSITGQSEVSRKCITAVGPWLWLWGPSLYRSTYEGCARMASSQFCRGAVESHSCYLANYTLFAYLYVSRWLTSISTLACDLTIKFNNCPWVQELQNFSTRKSALSWSGFGVNLASDNQRTTLARCLWYHTFLVSLGELCDWWNQSI